MERCRSARESHVRSSLANRLRRIVQPHIERSSAAIRTLERSDGPCCSNYLGGRKSWHRSIDHEGEWVLVPCDLRRGHCREVHSRRRLPAGGSDRSARTSSTEASIPRFWGDYRPHRRNGRSDCFDEVRRPRKGPPATNSAFTASGRPTSVGTVSIPPRPR